MNYPYITLEDATPLPAERAFLFHWMPKCAGTSIRDALLQTLRGRLFECNNGHPEVFDPTAKCVTFYHSNVLALVDLEYVSAEWVADAFGFAFVRNTWDRLVSLYFYLLRTAIANQMPDTFSGFISKVVEGDYPLPGPRSITGYYQANSLLEWLRPDGVWLPQFIGRFETVEQDWAVVTKLMGITCHLPHRNISPHKHYSTYYTYEDYCRVRDYFAEEIDVFGFSFDQVQ